MRNDMRKMRSIPQYEEEKAENDLLRNQNKQREAGSPL